MLIASNAAEYASGSQIESSRSGSGLWDEPKNLNDDVLAEAEDRPIDDKVVWCGVTGRWGWEGSGAACVCMHARGFIMPASSR